MKRRKIIISVTNDLVSDQRVHRVTCTLQSLDFDVTLVGRSYSDSPVLELRTYVAERMRLFFRKGPLFYIEYQLRLFFYLIWNKPDILYSNDLDTLLPNFIYSKLFSCKLVYDSHEYFTGVPELKNRPFVRSIWKKVEKFILPKLKFMLTVNDSIAELYESEYKIKVFVLRNVPLLTDLPEANRKMLNLPENKKIVLLQGAGINVERGAEEAVLSMNYLDNTLLLIIGDGDVLLKLKELVQRNKMEEKVQFIPKQVFSELKKYTVCADLGLSLDKPNSINYSLSLPNKLFDYIHAGLPVLSTPLQEIKNIILKYQIGTFVDSHNPEAIANKIQDVFQNEELYSTWKLNTRKAANELCWQNEEVVLKSVFNEYGI